MFVLRKSPLITYAKTEMTVLMSIADLAWCHMWAGHPRAHRQVPTRDILTPENLRETARLCRTDAQGGADWRSPPHTRLPHKLLFGLVAASWAGVCTRFLYSLACRSRAGRVSRERDSPRRRILQVTPRALWRACRRRAARAAAGRRQRLPARLSGRSGARAVGRHRPAPLPSGSSDWRAAGVWGVCWPVSGLRRRRRSSALPGTSLRQRAVKPGGAAAAALMFVKTLFAPNINVYVPDKQQKHTSEALIPRREIRKQLH